MTVEDRDWMTHASCRQCSAIELWFPEPDDRASRLMATIICDQCPVKLECREYGADEVAGVWGGIYRSRAHRGPSLLIQEHGTRAGYKRHLRAGERACEACRRAEGARPRKNSA